MHDFSLWGALGRPSRVHGDQKPRKMLSLRPFWGKNEIYLTQTKMICHHLGLGLVPPCSPCSPCSPFCPLGSVPGGRHILSPSWRCWIWLSGNALVSIDVSCCKPGPISARMCDRPWTGKPPRGANPGTQAYSAWTIPQWVGEMSTHPKLGK